MANDKRISALTERTSFSANDYMVLDNAGEGESKKFLASMFTDQLRDMQNILGSKNMLVNKLSTTAVSGITYTVNSDGSITFTGQATDDISIGLCYRQGISATPKIFLPNGDYYLSGITGGSASSISLRVGVSKNGAFSPIGTNYNGSSLFTIDGDDGSAVGANPQVQIDIKSGTNFATPKTVYPMIRPASILDATYVPYVETNKQLQDDVANLNSALTSLQNCNTQGMKIGFLQVPLAGNMELAPGALNKFTFIPSYVNTFLGAIVDGRGFCLAYAYQNDNHIYIRNWSSSTQVIPAGFVVYITIFYI